MSCGGRRSGEIRAIHGSLSYCSGLSATKIVCSTTPSILFSMSGHKMSGQTKRQARTMPGQVWRGGLSTEYREVVPVKETETTRLENARR